MRYTNYTFRASQLGRLMTKSKSKTDILSETAKTYLRELFIEEELGIKKEITSKYFEKGNTVEEDILKIYQSQFGINEQYEKKRYKNDFINGEPDYITGEKIVDFKASWDVYTFFEKIQEQELNNKAYFWQVQGYMWLTGLQKAEVCYGLVDTPESIMFQEVQKMAYREGIFQESEKYQELEGHIRKQMTFSILDFAKLKVYKIDRDENSIFEIVEKVGYAREYLNNLHL